jgi:hypothetical protein
LLLSYDGQTVWEDRMKKNKHRWHPASNHFRSPLAPINHLCDIEHAEHRRYFFCLGFSRAQDPTVRSNGTPPTYAQQALAALAALLELGRAQFRQWFSVDGSPADVEQAKVFLPP